MTEPTRPHPHERLNAKMHPLVEHLESEFVRRPDADAFQLAVYASVAALHWLAVNVDVPNAPPTVDRVRLASTLRRMAARIVDRGGRL